MDEPVVEKTLDATLETPTGPQLSHIWGITGLTILLFISIALSGLDAMGNSFMVLAELAIVVPALVYLRVSGFSIRYAFRLHAISWQTVVVSLLSGLALSFVASAVDTMAGEIVSMPEAVRLRLEALLILDNITDTVLVVLGLVVGAAVCEELFFRGFLQTALEQKKGVLSAIVLSSLVFGIVHFNPWWFVSILFAGVILGVIATVSGSVYPGMIAHGVNNALSLLIVNAVHWDQYMWISDLETVPPPLAIASAIVLTLGIFYLHKHKSSTKDTTGEDRYEIKAAG